MKRFLTLLTILFFTVATATPAVAGRYRHPKRYHGHYYSSYHHDDWALWGVGLLTGAVITSIFYHAPRSTVVYESPSVVYRTPRTVVVERPPAVVYETPSYSIAAPTARASGQVAVTVGELNVRSGPGMNHSITGSARLGEILEVIGSAPGWLYVRTQSGWYGWVMAQFTSQSSPKG
ncbi:MAG: SH3 domain-containing protein [Desulfobacterales bacterium]